MCDRAGAWQGPDERSPRKNPCDRKLGRGQADVGRQRIEPHGCLQIVTEIGLDKARHERTNIALFIAVIMNRIGQKTANRR